MEATPMPELMNEVQLKGLSLPPSPAPYIEVPAGRECPARAGDHDGADALVLAANVADDLGEAVAHLGGLRVHDGRPVQRYLHHSSYLFGEHGGGTTRAAASPGPKLH